MSSENYRYFQVKNTEEQSIGITYIVKLSARILHSLKIAIYSDIYKVKYFVLSRGQNKIFNPIETGNFDDNFS